MSDLREGICLDAFWLNREQCCWAANDTDFGAHAGCSQVCMGRKLVTLNRIFRSHFEFSFRNYSFCFVSPDAVCKVAKNYLSIGDKTLRKNIIA